MRDGWTSISYLCHKLEPVLITEHTEDRSRPCHLWRLPVSSPSLSNKVSGKGPAGSGILAVAESLLDSTADAPDVCHGKSCATVSHEISRRGLLPTSTEIALAYFRASVPTSIETAGKATGLRLHSPFLPSLKLRAVTCSPDVSDTVLHQQFAGMRRRGHVQERCNVYDLGCSCAR